MHALKQAETSVPSRQGPDYVSPLAKFHPVPTRPVFEPQLAYPPLQLLDPDKPPPPAGPVISVPLKPR
jgi:hypothetical protein